MSPSKLPGTPPGAANPSGSPVDRKAGARLTAIAHPGEPNDRREAGWCVQPCGCTSATPNPHEIDAGAFDPTCLVTAAASASLRLCSAVRDTGANRAARLVAV